MREKRDLYALLASSAVIQGVGLLIATIYGIVLARHLGPADYGRYGLAMSVVALALIPAQFGFPLLATREAAATGAGGETGTPRQIFGWFSVRSLSIGLVVGTALFLALEMWRPSWAVGSPLMISLCAVLVCISPLQTVLAALLRGFGANLRGQAIDLIAKPAVALLWVYGVARMGSLRIGAVMSGQVIAALFCALVALALLARLAPVGATGGARRYQPENWRPVALSLMSNALLTALNGNYPLLVAGLFVSGAPIGVFRVALSSSALLALPFAIANIAAGPLVAREYARKDWAAIARITSHTTLAGFSLTAIGFLIVLVFGRFLIPLLFGPAYVGAYAPLMILGVSQLIICGFGLSGTYLNLTGNHSIVMQAFLISVPLGLISSLIMTPIWGVNGAAGGTIVMAAAWHAYVFLLKGRFVTAPLSLAAAIRTLRRDMMHQGTDDRV